MPHPSLRRTPTRPRFDHGAPISGIDSRPILLVALFVVVVFLLAASQMRTHALLVALPQPEAGLIGNGYPPVVHRIRVTTTDAVMFDDEAVTEAQLEVLLQLVSTNSPRAVLAFEPDGDASYDRSAQILALIGRAGLVDSRFCINGLEKHQRFDRARGHPLPMLTSIWFEDNEGAAPMVPSPEIDTCAPELYGKGG
jgi:biopolymer transport protein ExbD